MVNPDRIQTLSELLIFFPTSFGICPFRHPSRSCPATAQVHIRAKSLRLPRTPTMSLLLWTPTVLFCQQTSRTMLQHLRRRRTVRWKALALTPLKLHARIPSRVARKLCTERKGPGRTTRGSLTWITLLMNGGRGQFMEAGAGVECAQQVGGVVMQAPVPGARLPEAGLGPELTRTTALPALPKLKRMENGRQLRGLAQSTAVQLAQARLFGLPIGEDNLCCSLLGSSKSWNGQQSSATCETAPCEALTGARWKRSYVGIDSHVEESVEGSGVVTRK
mmetsp:Transcript_17717/g.35556  ORF Transcript_17717/g.35556 Transcript_17717/m.35556 type:complete len:277 (+) Transcript_17717:903-1733(+)